MGLVTRFVDLARREGPAPLDTVTSHKLAGGSVTAPRAPSHELADKCPSFPLQGASPVSLPVAL